MAGRATLITAALVTVLALVEGQKQESTVVLPSLCKSCCQGLRPCPPICLASCLRRGQCPKVTFQCTGPLQNKCRSDRDCRAPGERCCVRDCNRECLPTCPRCGRDEECIYETFVSCLALNCPPPPPPRSVCKPKPQCPVDDSGGCRGSLSVKCRSDADCSGSGERCCVRGCTQECLPTCRSCQKNEVCKLEFFFTCLATICPPPPPPKAVCKPRDRPTPIRTGVCPRSILNPKLVLSKSCTSDRQCPEDQRCCSTTFGRRCSPVCRNCSGPRQRCELQQVQCVRAPCPPQPICTSGPILKY